MRAWRDQLNEIHSESGDVHFFVPCYLRGKYLSHEDTEKIGSEASSFGLILSFTSNMMEAVPRCWRFSSELCIFIRFMATLILGNGEACLRRAMIDCQIPARIIALLTRERTPTYLKNAFPGSSVSLDVAATQMRPESNPNVHMMHMTGNSVLNSSDLNNPRGPGHNEYMLLLEALACLAGIKGINHATLVIRESDDVVRGRQWLSLTEEAVRALSIIFRECCAEGAPGMGQREMEMYLIRSSADATAVTTPKILDMLSKYPTTSSTDKDRTTYLSLEGFIAYYRDCIQTNDSRLRLDLHVFGFRPDLTRRSRECRYFKIGERETQCLPAQSVAWDVTEMFKDRPIQIGIFADYGLAHTTHLYSVAYDIDRPLMEYLVAAATYRKNTDVLIDRTLINIYLSSGEWEGNKFVSGATAMLEVIAATPGEDQQLRISRIMMSNIKAQRSIEYGSGVIVVLRALYHMQHSQPYRNDVSWSFNRYILLLKELYNLYPVFKWMSENRTHWSFIDRDFETARSNTNNGTIQNQARMDYGTREPDNGFSGLDRNTNSDSELGMQDSEEDEEDSHFDTVDGGTTVHDGPTHIIVDGAGNPAVNGTYIQDGAFEQAIRYVRDGIWRTLRYRFFIFLCNVSNNTKHWYISIVPDGVNPGTSSDIDFYTAPITEASLSVPPTTGWAKAGEGKDPAPRLIHRDDSNNPIVSTHQPQHLQQRMGNGTIVEDDGDDEGQSYL
jgi:ubiquitin carboxyl-terminal hydrolase 9/24